HRPRAVAARHPDPGHHRGHEHRGAARPRHRGGPARRVGECEDRDERDHRDGGVDGAAAPAEDLREARLGSVLPTTHELRVPYLHEWITPTGVYRRCWVILEDALPVEQMAGS